MYFHIRDGESNAANPIQFVGNLKNIGISRDSINQFFSFFF
jgi:hypothetical protein